MAKTDENFSTFLLGSASSRSLSSASLSCFSNKIKEMTFFEYVFKKHMERWGKGYHRPIAHSNDFLENQISTLKEK